MIYLVWDNGDRRANISIIADGYDNALSCSNADELHTAFYQFSTTEEMHETDDTAWQDLKIIGIRCKVLENWDYLTAQAEYAKALAELVEYLAETEQDEDEDETPSEKFTSLATKANKAGTNKRVLSFMKSHNLFSIRLAVTDGMSLEDNIKFSIIYALCEANNFASTLVSWETITKAWGLNLEDSAKALCRMPVKVKGGNNGQVLLEVPKLRSVEMLYTDLETWGVKDFACFSLLKGYNGNPPKGLFGPHYDTAKSRLTKLKNLGLIKAFALGASIFEVYFNEKP